MDLEIQPEQNKTEAPIASNIVSTLPQKKTSTLSSLGPIIALLIIILVVILGGLYLWGSMLTVEDLAPAPQTIKTPEQRVNSESIPIVTDETANWKTYTNTQYGFSFKYPSDWKLEQTEYDARLSKALPNGVRLGFGIAKVSYDIFQNDTKGTFLGREAYFKTFDGCAGEGGASRNECYLKMVEIVLGNKQVYDQTSQPYIRADALEVTYGVSKDVATTPTGSEHANYQIEIKSIFDQNKSLFDELSQKIELQ